MKQEITPRLDITKDGIQIIMGVDVGYEDCVSIGLQAREMHDKARWVLGEITRVVKERFGEEALDKFAVDIGVSKASLRRYSNVAVKIPEKLRDDYRHLSWSHFRVAAGRDDPEHWLELASDNEMSVEAMWVEIRHTQQDEPLPVKPTLYLCQECGKWYFRAGDMCEMNGEHKHLTIHP